MAGNTRRLNFSADDLPKNLTLMLTFETPDAGELYKDLYPLCWSESCIYNRFHMNIDFLSNRGHQVASWRTHRQLRCLQSQHSFPCAYGRYPILTFIQYTPTPNIYTRPLLET